MEYKPSPKINWENIIIGALLGFLLLLLLLSIAFTVSEHKKLTPIRLKAVNDCIKEGYDMLSCKCALSTCSDTEKELWKSKYLLR